jgi:hypothetical protein
LFERKASAPTDVEPDMIIYKYCPFEKQLSLTAATRAVFFKPAENRDVDNNAFELISLQILKITGVRLIHFDFGFGFRFDRDYSV